MLYELTLLNDVECLGDTIELLPWIINPFTFFDKRLALRLYSLLMFLSPITVGTGSEL